MSKYGDAAIRAVEICQASQNLDPVTAWKTAVGDCDLTFEGQKKGCPKSTFLGLCQEGLVKGIPVGCYTRGRLNKEYAVQAVRLLQSDSSLADDRSGLWHRIMAGTDKKPNGQMDVVTALFGAGLLEL
jgi:hypothetical protein